MARAPKKAEAADTSDVERRLWVLEQVAKTGRPFITSAGALACGVCRVPLAEVFDKGCGAELDEGCPHKAAE